MMETERTIRPFRGVALTFCSVIVTFFFTFANVSCQGQQVASLTGFQLAFGTEISKADMWGNAKSEKVSAEPVALFALLAAVAGAALALLGPAARKGTVAAGAAGALLLLVLKSKLARDATLQSSGLLDVSAGFAFVIAVLLFIGAAGLAWLGGREAHNTVSWRAPNKVPDLP